MNSVIDRRKTYTITDRISVNVPIPSVKEFKARLPKRFDSYELTGKVHSERWPCDPRTIQTHWTIGMKTLPR